MNFSAQRAIVGSMLVAIGLTCLYPSFAFAQKKYPDPYHPKVEELAKGAAKYLESSGGTIQENSIGALAVVECYKRYDGSVPTDVPYIEETVATLKSMVDGGSPDIFQNRETYFPAVAFILLAEYDAKKYEEQCTKILDAIIARQIDSGAFTYTNDRDGDTSQSQFGSLALYVARQHEFPFDPNVAKGVLEFYVDYQTENGTWPYKAKRPNGRAYPGTNSLHSASLSSVYLLGDLLRLSRRVKKVIGTATDSSLDLPPNVTFYNPKKDNPEGKKEKKAWGGGDGKGPVVDFERGRLSACKSKGNQHYNILFRLPANRWNSYFMYALERYCYFKEQAEGNLPKALRSWYDQGVDHIISFRTDSGALESESREKTLPLNVNTALYLLFLVRASEIISLPPVDTVMDGDRGFVPGEELRQGKNGKVVSNAAEKSLQGLIDALSDGNLDDRQLQQITEAMKRAIREFKQSGDRSRGEVTAFLKTMISEKNYFRRLVAIKFLAAEQEMDNVPALLYAMGDPDPEIAIQAHNGLRLISRKFDTFSFEDRGNKDDNLLALARLKRQWTKWYLDIRPDAELLE